MADVELLQFPYSHFNEKARWGLDWKGVPHTRTNLLPGPHALTVRRLTGQNMVPVVRFDEQVVFGSARILDELELRHPEPLLYPADAGERERALEIQRHFDEELGPKVRASLFAVLLEDPGYLCALFASEHPAPVRGLFRVGLPVVSRVMARSMGLTGPEAVGAADARTLEALDFVAKHAGPDSYLVGERFSVADLAAAALLAPVANPPDSTMARPEPMPAAQCAWLERWSDHPGTAWVLEIYRRHRGARAI